MSQAVSQWASFGPTQLRFSDSCGLAGGPVASEAGDPFTEIEQVERSIRAPSDPGSDRGSDGGPSTRYPRHRGHLNHLMGSR